MATGRKRGCCEGPCSSPQTSPRGCGPNSCPAKKEDLATLHPAIKVRPKSKDVLDHPRLCIGMITGAQHIAVNTIETAWIQVLANDRQWNLLAAVRVCTNDKNDALLVDLLAFQLMGCHRVVSLETPTEASFIHVEHVLLCVCINNDAEVR